MGLMTLRDPYPSFRFHVELNGLTEAGFAECAGLQAEVETEELREGGVNDYVHKLAKGSKHTNLTLKRGMTNSDLLWNWYRDVASGKIERKPVDVLLLGSDGGERWRWSFADAYPVKWVGPELKAIGSAVAVESLEFVHAGFNVRIWAL